MEHQTYVLLLASQKVKNAATELRIPAEYIAIQSYFKKKHQLEFAKQLKILNPSEIFYFT